MVERNENVVENPNVTRNETDDEKIHLIDRQIVKDNTIINYQIRIVKYDSIKSTESKNRFSFKKTALGRLLM